MPDTRVHAEIPAGYRVHLWTRFDEPELGVAGWNDLAARSDTNTVFQTYEWVTSWWKVFSAGRDLLLIAVFHENRLVGLAPLMRELSGTSVPALAFIGENNADYCDFLLGEPRLPVLRSILATLANQQDQWRELRLANLPEHSFTATRLHDLCQGLKLLPMSGGRIKCPALVFGDRATAEQAVLRRQSLKRPWSHFRKLGQVEIAEPQSLDELRAPLEQFFEQHVRRWRDTSTPSLFTNPRNREFYRELAHRLLPTGKLAFSRVTLDGHPLAFHFGFVHDGRYIWYKPSFDIDYQRHSPGTLMLRLLLLRAIERRCEEFDFTIGNEPFKYRYSNTTRHNLSLRIFPNRPSSFLRRLGMRLRLWLKWMTRR